jgi:undecaprenyl-diphosphatase
LDGNSLSLIDILVLSVVQGLTEFLPVSSSGHLVLLQHWLGTGEGDLFLAVVLHCGTLGSVLCIYRRELWRLLRLDADSRRYIGALAVGTLPAVVVGLMLKDVIERLFASPLATACALLVTALILFSSRMAKAPDEVSEDVWRPRAPSSGRALLIGLAQALAITPGISRSGSTIAASLWVGLPRAEAARFSFMLSIPAIAGALVLEVIQGEAGQGEGLGRLLVAAATAFLVGLIAITLTAKAVVRRHFWKFGFYCLILGVVMLIVLGR